MLSFLRYKHVVFICRVLVTNYVADCGKNDVESGLIAAMAVSAPWNISLSCEVLERPVNWYLFNRILARELCKTVNRYVHHSLLTEDHETECVVFCSHAEVLQPVFDLKQLEGVRTIRQFDDVYTAKMFGYSGVEDYYKSATLHTKVDLIKTPMLALNAADDMFSPYEGRVYCNRHLSCLFSYCIKNNKLIIARQAFQQRQLPRIPICAS